MAKVWLARLPHGTELCSWLEAAPFRSEAELRQGAAGRVVAHTLKMVSSLDTPGYVPLTRHVAVTFAMFGRVEGGIDRFTNPAVARGMEIEATASGVTLHFDSVHGAQAWIKAKRIEVSFAPQRPEELPA